MSERLRRLLLLVPAARARPGIAVGELAASLGCTEETLRRDIDVLACVGTPPFLPDDLIDIELRNDQVYVSLPQTFERPAKLLATEAAALVIAARAVAPHDPLTRSATEKLGRAIAPPHHQLYESLLARFTAPPIEHSEAIDTVIRHGIASRRQVEIEYFAPSRLQAGAQRIKPRAFGTVGEVTYLSAQRADGAERTYRLDRITSATLLDERFDQLPDIDMKAELDRLGAFDRRADLPTATMRFRPDVAEAAKARHATQRETADGVEVDLPYSSIPWLVSYVLSWGGAAEIVAPAEAREALATAVREALQAHSASVRDGR